MNFLKENRKKSVLILSILFAVFFITSIVFYAIESNTCERIFYYNVSAVKPGGYISIGGAIYNTTDKDYENVTMIIAMLDKNGEYYGDKVEYNIPKIEKATLFKNGKYTFGIDTEIRVDKYSGGTFQIHIMRQRDNRAQEIFNNFVYSNPLYFISCYKFALIALIIALGFGISALIVYLDKSSLSPEIESVEEQIAGEEITENAIIENSTTYVVCKYCGAKNEKDAINCSECGAGLK